MNGWWLVSSIKGVRKGGMEGVAEVCIHLLILHIHISILYFLTYQKDHSFKACKIMSTSGIYISNVIQPIPTPCENHAWTFRLNDHSCDALIMLATMPPIMMTNSTPIAIIH